GRAPLSRGVFGQAGPPGVGGRGGPAHPGLPPSLMTPARGGGGVALGPKKGGRPPRPPVGSGYERVRPVPPHRPVVPAGAPGELRLDARKADVIPDYPY